MGTAMADSGLEQNIRDAANMPENYEIDGEKVSQRPLPDLIEADRHLAARRAAKNPWKAVRFFQISRPGTVR